MALSSKLKTNNGSEHQSKTTTLNAKVKLWLWTPNGKWTMALNVKLRRDSGYERPNEKRGSVRQMEEVALNAKPKKWL